MLHRRDEAHLRAFAAFVGCDDRPLAPVNAGDGLRLAIGCAPLARQLIAFGVVAGRGRDLHQPVGAPLARDRDFWRGLVDGDGSLKL